MINVKNAVDQLKKLIEEDTQKTIESHDQRLDLDSYTMMLTITFVKEELGIELDMDTLDLLEDMLSAFDGTLLLVSHDREFLNRLVTSVIALEGDGVVEEYADLPRDGALVGTLEEF